MSASESKSTDKTGLRRGSGLAKTDLSTLRAQYTSTPSPSLDQTLMQNSRFREEEKSELNCAEKVSYVEKP